ncbi:MAG TPA: hypothetical protein PLR26_03400 [Bacilli bacterium]|nr:hypothetical protein [Bacilli bacterium]
MYPNIVTEILTVIVFIFVGGLIGFGVTKILLKISKKLTFFVPIVSGVASAIFWGLAFITDGWGALGYFLYGSLTGLFFIGTLVSSLLIWAKEKQKNK